MKHYIDGFVLPIPVDQIETYRDVVEKISKIWKEHGALEYSEFISENTELEGTLSFTNIADLKEDEIIVFGWVVFESREARDLVNERVASDPRMQGLLAPLIDSESPIFDANRMYYGGFRPLF